ncbi:hypothetical protein [Streptomyces tendae]|uniref:hypothetical protein n=1 Tax=Streptomyces tendae TaxID=1932 RepID=UPI003EBC00EF
MTTLPRYALRLPDGRWAYHLTEPTPRPGTRSAVYADGNPDQPLTALGNPQGPWYAADHLATKLTAVYQPPPETIGFKLSDPAALSQRYPDRLTPEEWSERVDDSDEYWNLYKRITQDRDPVVRDDEGPFLPLDGGEPPAPDALPWRADLPVELTQRPEYRHAFPGHIPGLKQHLADRIKTMRRVQYCFVDYQQTPGIHVTLRVPYDQPRTEFKANTGRRGQPLKSGRTVQVLVTRTVDLPVPAAVYGPNYQTALEDWERQVAFWLAQVKEATVAACSACDGKGYVPHGALEHSAAPAK